MRWLAAAAGVVGFAMSAGVVRADEAEANRLLVEAIALAAQAAQAAPDDAIALYEQAAANLDAIVADHPDSQYAVLIATNQPIGSFRTWEVRHELARLTQPEPAPAPAVVAAVAPWEHRFGDGSANVIRGDPAYLMTDLIARDDGSVVVLGTYWHDSLREVWLTAYAADGSRMWERTYSGSPCSMAPTEDGIVVLAQDLAPGQDQGVLMLLDDGTAPTGFPLDFEPFSVAADGAGGFVVMGRDDGFPIVERFRADGDLVWTVRADRALVAGAPLGAVTAAAPIPGSGEIRLLGYSERAGDAAGSSVIWTAIVGDEGTMRDLVELDEVSPPGGPTCDPVLNLWSVDIVPDGIVLRYDGVERTTSLRRTTVLRLDAGGVEQWRQLHPIDPQSRADPQAAIEAGVDEIAAVSTTADGGVLVAGYRNRPAGRGSGFVSRWDADGNVLWSTELRRPVEEDGPVADAYFAAVAEAADGGVVAVMSDGVKFMRPRAFVFRLGADGTAP